MKKSSKRMGKEGEEKGSEQEGSGGREKRKGGRKEGREEEGGEEYESTSSDVQQR